MARVFVSYRRADGPYAVNWLADRLAMLDSVNHVESAFHDRDLRGGDDFGAALEKEIAEAELMIAVIGPQWLGTTGTPYRTLDESDWVVQEIRTALEHGTVVLPVLVDGAAPPLESQLHPGIQQLAGLHALALNHSDDMDKVVAHADSHLREIDAERVAIAGLAEPIRLAPLARRGVLATAAVALSAVFGATLAAMLVSLDPGRLPDDALVALAGVLLVVICTYGAAIVVYPNAVLFRLHKVTTLDRAIAVPIAAAWLLVVTLPWVGFMWSELRTILVEPPTSWMVVMIALAVVTLVGAFPVEVLLFSIVSTRPRDRDLGLADRVRHHALCVDAQRWGVTGLGSGGALLVALLATIVAIAGRKDAEGVNVGGAAVVISIGSIMAVALAGAHLWTTARMASTRHGIDIELDRLPSFARSNATVGLAAPAFLGGGIGLRVMISLPLVAAVAGSVLVLAWPELT